MFICIILRPQYFQVHVYKYRHEFFCWTSICKHRICFNRYAFILENIPGEIQKDWFVDKILKKIAKFGSVSIYDGYIHSDNQVCNIPKTIALSV